IRVTAPITEGFTAGQTSTLVFNAKNFGSADSFRFIATDNRGYLRSVGPGTFTLNTNEARDVSLQIMPPSNANAGDSSILTVSVESTSSPGISNGTTLLLLVTEGFIVDHEPPKLNVAASPAVLWPPDHKMKQIDVTIQVSDNMDPSPTVKLESITSN